jgi:hypothetical protein
MEHNPSWKADSRISGQEIPQFLLKPMVDYRVHKSLPPGSVLSHMNESAYSHHVSFW